jgi:hypothetical protein
MDQAELAAPGIATFGTIPGISILYSLRSAVLKRLTCEKTSKVNKRRRPPGFNATDTPKVETARL